MISNKFFKLHHTCTRLKYRLVIQHSRTFSNSSLLLAGHNRWSKIRHAKGAKDLQKANIMGKLTRGIITAIKNGGTDPSSNMELSSLLKQAKQYGVAKSTLDAAFKKATDPKTGSEQNLIYQVLGPGGVSLIVEAMTDKPTRTSAFVRTVVKDGGGSVTDVIFNFEKTGRISFTSPDKNVEQMLEDAIEVGAEDIEEDDDGVHLFCQTSQLRTISDALESMGYEITELTVNYYRPTTVVEVEDDKVDPLDKLIRDLEELDDVTRVYTNAA